MSRSGNSVIGYGLRYPMLEFVNDVRLIKHRFTSYCIFSFLTDFLKAFWPVACSVRCALRRIHTMRRRIGDRSVGGSVPIPSQLDRARTRFSTKIGLITTYK